VEDNTWGKAWEQEQTERREFRNKVLAWILIPILVIGGLVSLSFGLGWMNVGYKNTIGVAEANADRNIFKENKSYVEGMISDLAKYKYELSTEKDTIARKAIIDLIIDKFASFDIKNLENSDLKKFLQDIRDGKY
jgi:hypothetical protein